MSQSTQQFELLNGLALAYIGDAVYEMAIRDYLIRQGNTKPNMLHRKATRYVSAKGQAWLIKSMIEEAILTDREAEIYRRGRNAKSHTTAKNADVMTYRHSTGFEALFGYLHLTEQQQRLEELVAYCIEKVEETHGKK